MWLRFIFTLALFSSLPSLAAGAEQRTPQAPEVRVLFCNDRYWHSRALNETISGAGNWNSVKSERFQAIGRTPEWLKQLYRLESPQVLRQRPSTQATPALKEEASR